METDATLVSGAFAGPSLTAGLPEAHGVIKVSPEDFVVEEIPAHLPEGQGDHLYLRIEKRDLAHEQLLDALASALEVPRRDIGYAGMKDRRAVTRQWVSVPVPGGGLTDERLAVLEQDGVRVLDAVRHPSKLRAGELLGNRFDVRVRWADDADADASVAVVLDRLAQIDAQGFANYYGAQRFGADGDNAQRGLQMLRGDDVTRDVHPRRRRFVRKLLVSAAQSLLFNRVLAARTTDRLLHRVIEGDVLARTDSGGLFRAQDVAREQERLDARRVVIAGPMFGPKMMRAGGEALARERAVLEEVGLTLADFEPLIKVAAGTRRPMLIWPEQIGCDVEPGGVRLRFSLPAGAYATVLLHEVVGSVQQCGPEQ